MKKLISALLSLALILGLIPFGALNVSAQQTVPDPNDRQIEFVGGEKPTAAYDDIIISKTIEPVLKDGEAIENYFDITLKLTSPPHPHTHTGDVVLVIDNSGTMADDHTGGHSGYANSRMKDAKAAAVSFVEALSAKDGTHGIGIVTFATNAEKVSDIITNEETILSAIRGSDINDENQGIKANTTDEKNKRLEYTNIEGGLTMAYDMLKTSTAEHKYIILLTDGFPTTYLQRKDGNTYLGYSTHMEDHPKYAELNNDADAFYQWIMSQSNKEGLLYNTRWGVPCLYGTNYSDEGAKRAEAIAQQILADTDNDINLFSIGLDIGSQSVSDYDTERTDSEGRNFSIVDQQYGSSGTPTIEKAGKVNNSFYAGWLSSLAGGPIFSDPEIKKYWDANSPESLEHAYSDIIKILETVQRHIFRHAEVIDPIGDNVEFIGFHTYDGNLTTNTLPGAVDKYTEEILEYGTQSQHTPGQYGENDALFTKGSITTIAGATYTNPNGNGVIQWDPVESGWRWDGTYADNDPKRPNYYMLLKYRVRLKNEADGYVEDNDPTEQNGAEPDTYNETNGKTTFVYYDFNNDKSPEEEFPIPAVEGYLGELEFTKTDADGNALNGAEFTLKHSTSCTVCADAKNNKSITENVTISNKKAVSGMPDSSGNYTDPGKVKFENIPSGHDYTLQETQAPVGYKLDSTTYSVAVNYNTVTVSPAINEGKIPNEKLEPIDVTLQVEKLLDGNLIGNTNKEFKFQLSTTPTFEPENILQTAANDNSGAVKFAPIKFGPDLLDASNNKLADYQVTSQPQDFVFYIREVLDIGADTWHEDILYDENIIKATVKIDVDYANNVYTQTVTYTDYDTPANAVDNFANTSRPGVSLKFSPKKLMDNTVKSGYKFGLYTDLALTTPVLDASGNPIEVFSNSNGLADITLPEITKSGFYTYYLAEIFEVPSSVNEPVHRIVFDPTIYKIEFEVKCPLDNKNPFYIDQSKAIVTAYDRNNTNEPISNPSGIELVYSDHNGVYVYSAKIANELELPFNNLTRQHVSVPLTITKTMDGKAAKVGQFSFVLEDLTEDPYNPKIYNAKNADNGNIIFTTPEDGETVVFPNNDKQYNEPATYHYRIYETDQTNEQIVYDYSVYDVTIDISAPNEIGLASYVANVSVEKSSSLKPGVVTDSWSYTISKHVNPNPDPESNSQFVTRITGTERNALTFANKTRDPASVYFSARKTLNFHKPGEDDIFSFILIDATSGNDIEIMERRNDGYGVDFGTISYNKSGQYTYKVYERSGDDKDVTYDKSLYTIVVDVTVDIRTDKPFAASTTLYKNGNLYTDDPVPTFKNFKYSIPNTGDISHLALYGITAAISGAALIVIVRKKRRNSDQ